MHVGFLARRCMLCITNFSGWLTLLRKDLSSCGIAWQLWGSFSESQPSRFIWVPPSVLPFRTFIHLCKFTIRKRLEHTLDQGSHLQGKQQRWSFPVCPHSIALGHRRLSLILNLQPPRIWSSASSKMPGGSYRIAWKKQMQHRHGFLRRIWWGFLLTYSYDGWTKGQCCARKRLVQCSQWPDHVAQISG